MTGSAPAGWYPDGTGQTRYWTGTAWTDHVAAPVVVATPAPVYVTVDKGTNHVFHLLMSLITAGLWIPVWIIAGIANRPRR